MLSKLLHCSEQGTELGWLLDPREDTVLAVFPEQRVWLLQGDTLLPVLNELDLVLTAAEIFGWLML